MASRVVRFHRLGPAEVLQIETRAVPTPGREEVPIGVRAIGLNRADVMFRTGQFQEKTALPAQLGFEAVGEVLAIGGGVSRVSVGLKFP